MCVYIQDKLCWKAQKRHIYNKQKGGCEEQAEYTILYIKLRLSFDSDQRIQMNNQHILIAYNISIKAAKGFFLTSMLNLMHIISSSLLERAVQLCGILILYPINLISLKKKYQNSKLFYFCFCFISYSMAPNQIGSTLYNLNIKQIT